jgi:hypothetical protein
MLSLNVLKLGKLFGLISESSAETLSDTVDVALEIVGGVLVIGTDHLRKIDEDYLSFLNSKICQLLN